MTNLDIDATCVYEKKLPRGSASYFRVQIESSAYCLDDYFWNYKVKTKANDLELEWIIKASASEGNLKLSSIGLEKSNKRMVANFSILGNSAKEVSRGTVSSTSLPFERQLNVNLNYYYDDAVIIIHIYHKDNDESEDNNKRKNSQTEVEKKTNDRALLILGVGSYKKFLDNGVSDVTFVVGNEELPAHQAVIAANSDVFATMFKTGMAAKKSCRIVITDIESRIFKLLLRFFYGGIVYDDDTEELLKLIVAACKYSMGKLIKFCEDRIIRALRIENVLDVLIVADLANLNSLRKKCIDLIKINKDVVVGAAAFETMVKSAPVHLLVELFRSI